MCVRDFPPHLCARTFFTLSAAVWTQRNQLHACLSNARDIQIYWMSIPRRLNATRGQPCHHQYNELVACTHMFVVIVVANVGCTQIYTYVACIAIIAMGAQSDGVCVWRQNAQRENAGRIKPHCNAVFVCGATSACDADCRLCSMLCARVRGSWPFICCGAASAARAHAFARLPALLCVY